MPLDGTYAYAAPFHPEWEHPAVPTVVAPNIKVTISDAMAERLVQAQGALGSPPTGGGLEDRLDRIERLLQEICERLAVREAMEEMLRRVAEAPKKKG